MIPRRHFLGLGGGLAAGLLLPTAVFSKKVAPAGPPLLDPVVQPKFVNPLPNPLAPSYVYQAPAAEAAPGLPLYEISAQQITHATSGLVDATGRPLSFTAWGYGTATQPPVYPGRSFDLQRGSRIAVRFANGLDGVTYPAGVPVDQSIHWADPLQSGGPGIVVTAPYLGPVPLVTHQHGGDTASESDGLPEAWSTPGASIVGPGYKPTFIFDNDQEAAHLWYHDHAMGVTRLNVYMGLAGNYFLRDANEQQLGLPKFPYEVPIVIQDRTFLATGELFYDAADPANPLAPNPTHLPENFGNVIMVNGVAWPVLDVEPRKYRLRVLNGSDSRVYDMNLSNGMSWTQIGSDLGLLDAPVQQAVLSVAPGERADVILDFARMAGQTIVVRNTARAPYPNGAVPDPKTTGQVMAFRVALPLSAVPDMALIPASLRPVYGPLTAPAVAMRVRKILLFEGLDGMGRLQTMLGIVDSSRPALDGTLMYMDPITENPQVGQPEIWEFYNTTADAHPIHMHLVDFRILDRQKFKGTITPKTHPNGATGGVLQEASIRFQGKPRVPGPEEAGRKDTAKMFPGEVTRVAVTFKRPGMYVYHCHILSHEDHEMMRPYHVGPMPSGM